MSEIHRDRPTIWLVTYGERPCAQQGGTTGIGASTTREAAALMRVMYVSLYGYIVFRVGNMHSKRDLK